MYPLSLAAPATAPAVVPTTIHRAAETTGNQPITVNNASAASGATLLTAPLLKRRRLLADD